jgi:Uma2 family endonuclease
MAIGYDDIPVRDGGFTVADLADMPDDGRRYELVDGVLLVSPAPRWPHQHACAELSAILKAVCPRDLVVFAPTPDVVRGPRTSVQPDLCVTRKVDLAPDGSYEGVPVLAVEVLSPSSLGIDRLLKRQVYATLGVPSYWIVDVVEPSVTVLTLIDGGYIDAATVTGCEPLTVSEPFAMTFRPTDLLLAR